MIHHIDLGMVLRRTVCDLYSDLVTRSTGAAVRLGIEQQLAESHDATLTVIDFSQVGLLDFSCADEIVAKLLLRTQPSPPTAYFLFRGISEAHLDAIETVLERHGLAIVAQDGDGGLDLVGAIGAGERKVWEAVCRLGSAAPCDVAREAGLEPEESDAVLAQLTRHRLVMPFDQGFVAVGLAT